MADGSDGAEKTEDASRRRIEDALEKGNVPFSREAPVFAALVALLAVLGFIIRERLPPLVATLARMLDGVGDVHIREGADATAVLVGALELAGLFLAPIVALVGGLGLIGSLSQNAPALVVERIRPQLSRISPGAGLKRLFGIQGLVEFVRSLFKFLAVGTVCVLLLKAQIARVLAAIETDPALIPGEVLSLATRLIGTVCAVTIVLVAADLLWARLKWRRDLRMSRQELKEEIEEDEGDPLLKARMRSVARDRSRKRMLSNVPKATLVIANPTHFAIALRYKREEGGAPMVLAKGQDLLALRIKEIALRNHIPVIEDPLLARTMYKAVEVDKWIPAEFYRAVAKVLFYLYSRDQQPSASLSPSGATMGPTPTGKPA